VASGKPFYAHPNYEVFDDTVFNKTLMTSGGGRNIVWVSEQGHKKVMCFQDTSLWEYDSNEIVALAVCSNAVVVAKESEIVALNLKDGKILWSEPVPSTPIPWGLAIDRDGHIIATLKNGHVMCFGHQEQL